LQREADDQVRKRASIDIPLLPSSRQDDRLAKLYRLESVRSTDIRLVFNSIVVFFLAAEQTESDRREAIDQQQVLKGTSSTASEINWAPSTFTSNKKQLSSALGIVRKIDKTSETTQAKSLVSYGDDDDDDDED